MFETLNLKSKQKHLPTPRRRLEQIGCPLTKYYLARRGSIIYLHLSTMGFCRCSTEFVPSLGGNLGRVMVSSSFSGWTIVTYPEILPIWRTHRVIALFFDSIMSYINCQAWQRCVFFRKSRVSQYNQNGPMSCSIKPSRFYITHSSFSSLWLCAHNFCRFLRALWGFVCNGFMQHVQHWVTAFHVDDRKKKHAMATTHSNIII